MFEFYKKEKRDIVKNTLYLFTFSAIVLFYFFFPTTFYREKERKKDHLDSVQILSLSILS